MSTGMRRLALNLLRRQGWRWPASRTIAGGSVINGESITKTLIPIPYQKNTAFITSPSACRFFASSSSSSTLSLINSVDQFDSAIAKIRDESSPAVLYFTAAWCGPCRFMSPAIEELSKKYPHVTTYKIDIDQESIQDKLFELKIDSVPRLYFYQNGEKVDEIIGADIERLKYTMERLYK